MDPRFRHFLSDDDEKKILEAIAKAEAKTSGEIRVHLHKKIKGDILENAIRKFRELEMHRTRERNGILIFIDVDSRRFAVIGDEGIHRKVGQDFWEELKDVLTGYFRRGQYAEGIIRAVERIGERLKQYFPVKEDDTNELPDDISYDA